RSRTYRKHVAYSDEEAILVAVGVLRAHFFELPVIVNAAIDAFKDTYLGTEKETKYRFPTFKEHSAEEGDSYGREKNLDIEIETEATLVKNQLENLRLARYAEGDIEEIRERLDVLRDLVIFGENNGDSSGT